MNVRLGGDYGYQSRIDHIIRFLLPIQKNVLPQITYFALRNIPSFSIDDLLCYSVTDDQIH